MNTAIIIPTYNEAENIGVLVQKILALGLSDSKIIIIDDNSPDGTGEIVESLSKKFKNKVIVIHRKGKLGLGSAYKVGFEKALKNGAQTILTMDADLSHDPRVIPKMLVRLKESDVVIGSRHIPGGKIVGFNAFRTLLSKCAQILCMKLVGLAVHDSTSALRAYKVDVLKKVNPQTIRSEGYSFLIELMFRCQRVGFKLNEFPITYLNRTRGKSKISQKEIFKALITVVRLKFGG